MSTGDQGGAEQLVFIVDTSPFRKAPPSTLKDYEKLVSRLLLHFCGQYDTVEWSYEFFCMDNDHPKPTGRPFQAVCAASMEVFMERLAKEARVSGQGGAAPDVSWMSFYRMLTDVRGNRAWGEPPPCSTGLYRERFHHIFCVAPCPNTKADMKKFSQPEGPDRVADRVAKVAELCKGDDVRARIHWVDVGGAGAGPGHGRLKMSRALGTEVMDGTLLSRWELGPAHCGVTQDAVVSMLLEGGGLVDSQAVNGVMTVGGTEAGPVAMQHIMGPRLVAMETKPGDEGSMRVEKGADGAYVRPATAAESRGSLAVKGVVRWDASLIALLTGTVWSVRVKNKGSAQERARLGRMAALLAGRGVLGVVELGGAGPRVQVGLMSAVCPGVFVVSILACDVTATEALTLLPSGGTSSGPGALSHLTANLVPAGPSRIQQSTRQVGGPIVLEGGWARFESGLTIEEVESLGPGVLGPGAAGPERRPAWSEPSPSGVDYSKGSFEVCSRLDDLLRDAVRARARGADGAGGQPASTPSKPFPSPPAPTITPAMDHGAIRAELRGMMEAYVRGDGAHFVEALPLPWASGAEGDAAFAMQVATALKEECFVSDTVLYQRWADGGWSEERVRDLSAFIQARLYYGAAARVGADKDKGPDPIARKLLSPVLDMLRMLQEQPGAVENLIGTLSRHFGGILPATLKKMHTEARMAVPQELAVAADSARPRAVVPSDGPARLSSSQGDYEPTSDTYEEANPATKPRLPENVAVVQALLNSNRIRHIKQRIKAPKTKPKAARLAPEDTKARPARPSTSRRPCRSAAYSAKPTCRQTPASDSSRQDQPHHNSTPPDSVVRSSPIPATPSPASPEPPASDTLVHATPIVPRKRLRADRGPGTSKEEVDFIHEEFRTPKRAARRAATLTPTRSTPSEGYAARSRCSPTARSLVLAAATPERPPKVARVEEGRPVRSRFGRRINEPTEP